MSDSAPSGGGNRPIGKCNAKKGSGELCKLPSGYGTGHPGVGPCKYHFGATPQVEGGFARKRIKDAALEHLISVGKDKTVENLTGAEALREEMVRSYVMVSWLEEQTDTDMAMWPEWQVVLMNERKHLVHVASVMVRSGLEERQVRIMETQAAALAAAIRAILQGLQLTPSQQAMAPGLVRGALAELTVGAVN